MATAVSFKVTVKRIAPEDTTHENAARYAMSCPVGKSVAFPAPPRYSFVAIENCVRVEVAPVVRWSLVAADTALPADGAELGRAGR